MRVIPKSILERRGHSDSRTLKLPSGLHRPRQATLIALEPARRARKPIVFAITLLWILGLEVAWASPVPTVTKVTPSPAIYGNATLTITGGNFDSSAQVAVNGVAFTTKFVSAKKLSAKGV